MAQKNITIHPDLQKFEKYVALKNGTIIHIRPICDRDVPSLELFLAMLSDKSIFYRFGSRRIDMSRAHLTQLCQVDNDRDFAFLAVIPREQENIIGEVRLNRLSDDETAELSFVIADKWQGKGIGKQLMDFCLVAAKELRLTTLLMEVMKNNIRMMQFGYKYDFQRLPSNKEHDMETLELTIAPEATSVQPFGLYSQTKWLYNERFQGIYG